MKKTRETGNVKRWPRQEAASKLGLSESGVSATGMPNRSDNLPMEWLRARSRRTGTTLTSDITGQAKAILADATHLAALQFRAWYERNFVNPRAGMIGMIPYERAGEMDDHVMETDEDRWIWHADAYDRAWTDYRDDMSLREIGFVLAHPLVAFQLAVGITDLRGLRCYRRGLSAQVARLQRKSYRSRYYAKENARRRKLAAERRKVTARTTTNPCPKPTEIRMALARAEESTEAKVRLGSLLEDLACYVDSRLRYDADGNIVGRNGGIKAWLAENIPDLFPRYKTLMRYKALAKRLRQAADLRDPVPADAIFEAGEKERDETEKIPQNKKKREGKGDKNYMRKNYLTENVSGNRRKFAARKGKQWPVEVRKRLNRARRIVAGATNTVAGLFAAIDAALDADG